jgi:hypothetical protein
MLLCLLVISKLFLYLTVIRLTSNFHSVANFLNFNTKYLYVKFIFTCLFYRCTEFRIPDRNGSTVTVVKELNLFLLGRRVNILLYY